MSTNDDKVIPENNEASSDGGFRFDPNFPGMLIAPNGDVIDVSKLITFGSGYVGTSSGSDKTDFYVGGADIFLDCLSSYSKTLSVLQRAHIPQ